ncbi:MAG: AraC family transcriptional regulator [Deltaproteobacteria bacterium]|nr:AraC family transcriptional regulator [Deltaproteobacteria bacterium]
MGTSLQSPVSGDTHRVLPDGCIDIIFDFGDLRPRSPAYVVGTMSRPVLVGMAGQVDLLGVRFRPGGCQPFLEFNAAECTDDTADLECFWGKAGAEVWDRLATLANTRARISYLESYLLKEFGWRLGLDPYVQFSVRLIQRERGAVAMAALEKGTGLSGRQLERKFARDIGLSPKAFARVVRFEHLVRTARAATSLDWTQFALDGGYSDQSHLIRDFKAFSGRTPAEFFAAQ